MPSMCLLPIYFDVGLEDEAEALDEEQSSEEGDGSPLQKRAKTEDEESDNDDFTGPTLTEEQMELFLAYQDHVRKYHGFHVDMSLWPDGVGILGGIEPVDIENDATEKAEVYEAARRAIKMHKLENPEVICSFHMLLLVTKYRLRLLVSNLCNAESGAGTCTGYSSQHKLLRSFHNHGG
ncbi:unnamed protein product [Cuscuta epithymum]|uniref:Uncharacterized protein n=1 Tax=Cuscuta epithymum TaxID=186058 RepID=A0AAV0GDT2_9ASTE|nr:unnamed protein product [Cuscuta epithymum]